MFIFDFKKLHFPKLKCSAFFQRKSRYCVNLSEDEKNLLRQQTDFLEEENILMLLDDSFFINRSKNAVFTDKRILWQSKRGAPYKSVMLANLNGSSVFSEQSGFDTIITILNSSSRASFRFKNIHGSDSLRIMFHDYLTRYCGGYNPFDKGNAARYEKDILPLFRKNPAASAFFSAIGIAALIVLMLFGIQSIRGKFSKFIDSDMIERLLLAFVIVSWSVNIIIPKSKSKFSKFLLLIFFAPYYCFFKDIPADSFESVFSLRFYPEYAFWGRPLFAFVWLLSELFDFDRFMRVAAVTAGILIIVLSLVRLTWR